MWHWMTPRPAPGPGLESKPERETRSPMPPPVPVAFGSSVIGEQHQRTDLPCQDAHAFAALHPSTLIVAVADGLGSASESAHGATIAARVAVDVIAQGIREKIDADLTELAEAGIYAARQQLELEAEHLPCQLRDLATTLIVAVAVEQTLAVAQIGDGAVVAEQSSGPALILAPTDSEYVNEVDPLTMDNWQDRIRVSPLWPECLAFAAFTDGCQRAALKRDQQNWQAFPGFFRPLFAYARTVQTAAEGQQELDELLLSEKVCDNCDDDKTLVIGVLDG